MEIAINIESQAFWKYLSWKDTFYRLADHTVANRPYPINVCDVIHFVVCLSHDKKCIDSSSMSFPQSAI